MAEVHVTQSWNALLEEFPAGTVDVYYREEYARLYTDERVQAKAFVRIDGGEVYLVPFLTHPNLFLGGERFDVSTPYGYGGPVSTTNDPRFIADSARAFSATMREMGGVAGFVRCHPLLDTHERLGGGWSVRFDRATVGGSLDCPAEEIWEHHLDSKGRNRIRRAEKAGVEFVADENLEYLDSFMAIYHHAMDLVGASSFYYFDRDYFSAIKEGLGDEACLMCGFLDGELVAGMLFLCDDTYAHAHLSGSRIEHRDVAPNNLVLHRALLHARERGCKMFHVGGGSSTRADDSLLRFKGRFSRDRYSFHIAGATFDAPAYARAVESWAVGSPPERVDTGVFPPYGLQGPAA